MRPARLILLLAAALVAYVTAMDAGPARVFAAPAAQGPTVAQVLSAASPLQVVAARNVDRIAWIAYEQGKRNVYTAIAPAFAPVRLTAYLKDDGVELTDVTISADGSTVVFV